VAVHGGEVYNVTSTHVARPERDPYQTFIMGFLIIGGLSTLTSFGGHPKSIDAILSGRMLVIWSIMLVVGSTLTLLGIVWRGRYITALGTERIGLILHTTACLVYTVALVVNWDRHNGAVVLTSFIGAIAIANCWRVWQITIAISRILFLSAQMDVEEGE
jgi:hypothetical protein